MKWLTIIWNWLVSLFRREQKYQFSKMEELPDCLEAGKIYLLGEAEYLWSAVMVCPCGCNATLHMNLQPDAKPLWSAIEHRDGTLTLHPSVWRKVGCRSHFFVRKGRIIWVDDTE
jgi:hypothetical protein